MPQPDEDYTPFSVWLAKVDAHLLKSVGMCSRDLADVNYREMWEDDYTPSAAARKAIRYNMV